MDLALEKKRRECRDLHSRKGTISRRMMYVFIVPDATFSHPNQLPSVIECTRQIYESSAQASSSRDTINHTEDYGRKNADIRGRIAELDAEVIGLEADKVSIVNQIALRLQEKEELERQLVQSSRSRVDPKGKGKAQQGINYATSDFAWSKALEARMKAVFGINEFRLCQRGYVALL